MGIFSLSFGLNWASSLLSLSILPRLFWLQKSQFSKTFDIVYANLRIELRSVLGKESVQRSSFLFSRVFSFIIFSNFIGLFPYIFTRSSHLSFTLTVRLAANMVAWHLLLALLGSQNV